ncbi:MAG: ferredoxin [Gaiellaceae bacterium]
MTQYRIEIDRSTCVGYGGCVREAPDVFWIEDELAYAEASTGDARALEAAELCPVSAITVVPLESDALAA